MLRGLVLIGMAVAFGLLWFPTSDSIARVNEPDGSTQVLPNWATPDELRRQTASRPQYHLGDPPQGDFRIPAEFEPVQAVVMTWAGFQTMLTSIAKGVMNADAEVWMVGGPASIAGIDSEYYRAFNFSYNSVWVRDYGPFGIREESGGLGIVDTVYRHDQTRPYDDQIPCKVASEVQVGCYTTSLILDGGNLLSDGRGGLFMTRRTYVWNDHLSEDQVDELLRQAYNFHTIHVFDYASLPSGGPADGTGHIDMFVKLLDECKVLVAECDQAPFKKPLEDAAAYFSTLECKPGKVYEVYRIPGWQSDGTWYTYTNSLMVNNRILVPGYQNGDDEKARAVYQYALPEHAIDMIGSDSIIRLGGSVHCVTMQVPDTAAECLTAQDCKLDHVAQHICRMRRCMIGACETEYANCNQDEGDGCETRLGTDSDCTDCNDICGEGEVCQLRFGGYECRQACQPTDEICNQKDDDCDGDIDEEGVCEAEQNPIGCSCRQTEDGGFVYIFMLAMAALWVAIRWRSHGF